ncbi:serine/threonine protein kinase [Leptothoe kymatousa]|uniref:Serine/threonine protein kinase n=1 Tax=Leptothoe kymatousa TAU-MAC 1615 TaxID=2364775 RepID=A0ABS5Y5A7_9CYAN|nr:serine/threonine-protein kinase [Leptothoe kymatousa]MBT9312688.1 serine/threonine protein kinase [Leptothoe kymatousa TAU-MAC 1615]
MIQWILNHQYRLETRLSKKGARHTYIATDLNTDQPVIVKVLLFGPEFQWQDHKLFERGAASLQTLSFPGIPHYLDYFDTQLGSYQGFAQVQSYIPAKSLQEHLQSGRTFSENELRQLALQLLEILAYLHQRQPAVIHRDIKPSNILLDDRTGNHVGQVHLVDFDSVKTGATQSDYTITIVGTYGYMPPEQFSGQASPASDLYSLGATLIYAATGKHPADLPKKHMGIEFQTQVNLSQHFIIWLKRLTNPDLDHRLRSAADAIQALNAPTPGQSLPVLSQHSIDFPIRLPAKPVDSKIMVSQTDHPQTLEILLPSRDLHPTLFWLFLLVGAPTSLIAMMIFFGGIFAFMNGRLGVGLLLSLILLPVGAIAAVTILPAILSFSQQARLRITPHNITKTYDFFGLRQHRSRRVALQLVMNKTTSRVSLKTSTHSFNLSTITLKEQEWLVQVLSKWLQLTIKYIP